MRQKFILEKEDIETLRNGGIINLAFAGGKIELGAEVGKKQLLGYEGRQHNAITKQNVLDYLVNKKIAVPAREIGQALGIENREVHKAIHKLKSQKKVVGSDNGWRVVHEATITNPSKFSFPNHNGKKVVHSNGR